MEVADSVSDLDPPGDTYQLAVAPRHVGGASPLWDEAVVDPPAVGKVVRLSVEGSADGFALGEWELAGINPACGGGASLRDDPNLPVVIDLDGVARAGTWDIGADNRTSVQVGFEASWMEDGSWSAFAWEEDGVATVDVILSEPAQVPVMVRYRTEGETAEEGVDYQRAEGTLWFDPGTTRQTITVATVADSEPDDGEVFDIDLFDPAGAVLRGEWVDVVLEDGAPPSRAKFLAAEAQAEEGQGTVQLTVVLDGPAEDALSVSWAVVDQTARVGLHYQPADGVLTFEQGQTTAVIELEIVDDDLAEPDEQLRVVLDGTDGAAEGALRAPRSAVVTISDDDGSMPKNAAAAAHAGRR